ncbi:MAG TPA: hypothetical protein VEP28_10705, partial [Rubrobacter sp.]|nr:hypothetical protein [Rubrobacter sp.]
MEPTTAGLGDLPLDPKEECDIVMKGGITSGVVYPLAVVELARKYRLRSIGGTSAGAIAAGLTAAAELRRRKGSLAGFEELARLPEFLQKNLTSLFQPAPGTRSLFEVLLTLIDKEAAPGRKAPPGIAAKVARILRTIMRFHALAFLGGTMQALFLFLLLVALPAGSLRPWALLVMLFFALAGGLLGAILDWAVAGLLAVQANAFGLCPGIGGTKERPALTPWLTTTLDRIAGKQPGEGPLTFADLWGRGGAECRDIDLQVMTTNLTHGVPERLPFKSSVYFYDSRELRRFFPEEIVDWMDRHPRASGRPRKRQDSEQDRLVIPADIRPLPSPADLPVVVAVRMSLSFPVLLSAIPLYAVERIRDEPAKKWRARLSRCWFSDGGIGSNFP